MRRVNPILLFMAILALGVSSRPAALMPPTPQRSIKWPIRNIRIALSSSLLKESTSITVGSDVTGALRRALDSWSAASGIKFEVVATDARSIGNDGVNLVTVATTSENLAIFRAGNNAAQTRVHFDQATGLISEADIVVNPNPRAEDGTALLFSTDGTPGTYDLESTFAHEIGHLLGLNHSNVIASTMQETQGINGTFGKPAFDARSLSEADRVAIMGLYGPCENMGTVSGRVLKNFQGRHAAVGGAHVWIEELDSGRVIASSLVGASGKFSMGCIAAGQYRTIVENVDEDDSAFATELKATGRRRILRRTEISSYLRISADKESPMSFLLAPIQNSVRTLRPRFYGVNGELSTVPIVANVGTQVRVFIGGQGVDQVLGAGLKSSSPYLTIDANSLETQSSGRTSVISFNVTIAADAPVGDYTFLLESKSGELAYLVGALSVPGL
ncbi:MAG TPA: matrixin family metalloprotease [Pyrinomonadaceae bacterium]|nr:matrixin family metalloprotease [Pyrinomonadaceae bacterium]